MPVIETNLQFSGSDFVAPMSPVGIWQTVRDVGSLANADTTPYSTSAPYDDTDPAIYSLKGVGRGGTNCAVRVGYAGTPASMPTLRLVGRTGSQSWEALTNAAYPDDGTEAPDFTPNFDTTHDADDGTLKYTTPDDLTLFDCRGCDEIALVVVDSGDGDSTWIAQIKRF